MDLNYELLKLAHNLSQSEAESKRFFELEDIKVDFEKVSTAVKKAMPEDCNSFLLKGAIEDTVKVSVEYFNNFLQEKREEELKVCNTALIFSLIKFVVKISNKSNVTDMELSAMTEISKLLFECM